MRWHLPWSAVDQSAEIAELRVEVERLRRDRHAARFERDQAIAERDFLQAERDQACKAEAEWQRNCSASARREYDLVQRLKTSEREELAQRREVERLRAVLREIGAAAEAAAGNEPAHSGQFVADSGSFGWIPVGERLPGEEIDEVDVLVAAETDNDRWTDRAWLANEDRSWRWSANDQPLDDGVRITHWMPVPEPPGCEGAPPVAVSQGSPWIRVADALPDDRDEEVVALAGGQPVLAHYSPSGGWHDCYWRDLSGVTHWARWPEEDESGGAGKEGSADA